MMDPEKNDQAQQTDPTPNEPTPNADPTPNEPKTDDTDYKALYEAEVSKHAETKKHMRHWEGIAKSNKDDNLTAALDRAKAAESELANLKAEKARGELLSEIAKDKGVDADVLARMMGDSREDIEANADALLAITPEPSSRKKFPRVTDTGEPGKAPALTREDIRKIKNPTERRRAIAENINLYK